MKRIITNVELNQDESRRIKRNDPLEKALEYAEGRERVSVRTQRKVYWRLFSWFRAERPFDYRRMKALALKGEPPANADERLFLEELKGYLGSLSAGFAPEPLPSRRTVKDAFGALFGESLSDLGRIMDVRETFEECLGEESLFLYKADWRAVL